MTKRFLLLAATGLAAIVTAGSAAYAAHPEPGPGGELFEKADTNGDGVVTAAEREAAKAEAFARIDADGNGAVTEEELKAERDAKIAEMKANWEEKRESFDGPKPHPKPGGFGRPGGPGGPGADRESPIERMDTNGDGTISRAEFLEHEPPMMEIVDANGDGDITKEEADAARQKAYEMMKEKRQNKGSDE